MEDTQVINWGVEEEEETEKSSESVRCTLEPLGRLHIFSSAHGPEKDFPLYLGENVVGRMPDCSVALPYPSISKQHAVIEILACNKAPVLRDCGSLNGTQILRPPTALSPGARHRLRDQDLILFADLPCQYHRLDAPLPYASRGPLTIEETPRVQGEMRPKGLLLAEDSEEEVDSESTRDKVSRTTFSPVPTVVPESDEEGASLAFNLDSDTDDEEGQRRVTRQAASDANRGTPAEAEWPGADEAAGVAGARHFDQHRPSGKTRARAVRVESDAGKAVAPVRVIPERSHPAGEDSDTDVDEDSRPPGRPPECPLERGQPSDFIDSDTDVEEEGIPATPVVVPMKRKQIFYGVDKPGPGVSALARLQKSQAGGNADGGEQGEAPLAVPLERSQEGSIVVNSDTDDEEEVLAALTLARLKESLVTTNPRGTDVEETRALPVIPLEHNQTSAGRDSDTDAEEDRHPGEKRQALPEDGSLVVAHSEKSQPPSRGGDRDVGERHSLGAHLQRGQASTTVDTNPGTEEKVTPQVPVKGIAPTGRGAEGSPAKMPIGHTEEEEAHPFTASELAHVRKIQLPAKGHGGTEWAATVLEQERVLGASTQDGAPVAQVKQDLVVDTGTPGDPSQPHREGAPHEGGTQESKDSPDDSEDLYLQATQCFVDQGITSVGAIQSVEEEPTQDFLSMPRQEEPGPSCYSSETPGTPDEPWELLPTQPFCPRAPEASETPLEAHGNCPPFPSGGASPLDQHPESPVHHTESLGTQGQEVPAEQEKLGAPRRTTGRVSPETKPLERGTEEPLPEGEREDGTAKEDLARGLLNRGQRQVLARAPQSLESEAKVKRAHAERAGNRLEVEMGTSVEMQETELERQALARGMFEREAERPAPESAKELAGTDVTEPTGLLEDLGAHSRETQGGGQDRRGRPSHPTPVASGSQSGRRRVAPMRPRRQQRGSMNSKMPPAGKPARGEQESPSVPEASARPPDPLIPQSPKCPVPQSPLSPTRSLEAPLPRTRQKKSINTLEAPLPPELEPLDPKSKVRARGLSRAKPSVSSTAHEPPPPTHIDQPVTPKPTSEAIWGRTHRSSVGTCEPVGPIAPEAQCPTSTDQPLIPGALSQAMGRTRRSSARTLGPVGPTAPELQPSTSTDQPVTPKPTARATRNRTQRSSVKTPEPVEVQLPISTDQPVTPKPTARATRSRTQRSSVKIPEPIEAQLPISTDQPVTPKPTARATRSRTQRSSVTISELIGHTAHELQSVPSKDPCVIPKPTSQARVHRSSAKAPGLPDLEPLKPADQPVNPEPILSTTRGRAPMSSVKTPEPVVPTAAELQPPSPIDQPVTPEASRNRRQRGARKQESLKTAPLVCEPCSTPAPQSQSESRLRRGAAESHRPIPDPASPQLLETPTRTSQIKEEEEEGSSGLSPEPRPKAPQSRKRTLPTLDSSPLPKRPPRGQFPQQTEFLKEPQKETAGKKENVVLPGPVKRKREQTEEEPKGTQSRSVRQRPKPSQQSTAPSVLFTGVVDARGERAVLALGGSLAHSVTEASHLVTDRIRRTVKFLCALGRGIPILSLDWLHQSRKAGCFLPPDEYIVTDPEQEKNFGFSLQDALGRARKQRLLEGYEVYVTPGVQPPPPQMGEIISCCGGTVLPSMPRSYKPQRVVITCSQDFLRCSIPLRAGLPVLSPEFLLTGVLKQEANPEAFTFSPEKPAAT
ncbi:mediator of DNA damage checkpoint protein 1 isoform X2 [Echinops telfairi]|uniref:Mediator of DNA damage checkpoint protein 1 isoform X2 n=1 Tax=Echinops telfairi TaxID=9371 RepID=A0AC55DA93_ECHTE|nr:mediator of DNA damage checkpoint protein 1 isoform X2 [Echinops telfairi]